jgi:hypothetical protein
MNANTNNAAAGQGKEDYLDKGLDAAEVWVLYCLEVRVDGLADVYV